MISPCRLPVRFLPLLLAASIGLFGCGPADGGAPDGGIEGVSLPEPPAWGTAYLDAGPVGEYVGQPLPGDVPELFAPGFITTGHYTRDVAMSPDGSELYFGILLGRASTIMETHRGADGRWSRPQVASFATDPRFFHLEPAMAPDGGRLMFLSTRVEGRDPEPEEIQAWVNQDIWVVDREGEGWGEPYNLGPPVNSEESEFFPSITSDGTLYFTRAPTDGSGSYIYRSRLEEGVYQEPERLGPEVNATANQFNAFIAPDESYIIVCAGGRENGLAATDYLISFRSPDDSWVGPINMGEVVNEPGGAGGFSPYVSPDGRYFFFMSTRPVADPSRLTAEFLWDLRVAPENGNADIYWMDAGFIEELRPAGF